jgi:hypothetical protein
MHRAPLLDVITSLTVQPNAISLGRLAYTANRGLAHYVDVALRETSISNIPAARIMSAELTENGGPEIFDQSDFA